MQLEPEDCLMVAAHAYDLRAAKRVFVPAYYVYYLEIATDIMLLAACIRHIFNVLLKT